MVRLDDVLSTNALVQDPAKRALVLGFISRTLRLPPLTRFPAPHPVALSRDALTQMQPKEWVVSVKADGVRVLLVCTEFEHGRFATVLVDRTLAVWRVRLRGPADKLRSAILDAELMSDGTLWAFDDLTAYDSTTPYIDRLERVRTFVDSVEGVEALTLKIKDVHAASEAAEALADADIACDGVVFTHIGGMGRADLSRRCERMMKFKTQHTVDLFVSSLSPVCLQWHTGEQLEAIHGTVGGVDISRPRIKNTKEMQRGCAAEFAAVFKSGLRLTYMHPREHTNNSTTVQRTLKAALEGLDIVSVSAVLAGSEL
jgi:hypothetical protein